MATDSSNDISGCIHTLSERGVLPVGEVWMLLGYDFYEYLGTPTPDSVQVHTNKKCNFSNKSFYKIKKNW